MAYSSHLITTLQEVIPLWAAFAQSIGWTVNSTVPTAPTITHPSQAGAIPFRLQYATNGTYGRRLVVDSPNATMTGTARMNAPVLNPTLTAGGVVISAPTRVHFIGSTTGVPFLATVVEFGFNSYRHLFVGYMNKSSAYDGGEIVSGTWGLETALSSTGSQLAWDLTTGVKPLFNGSGANTGTNDRGGLRVVHASNPTPWREFRSTTANSTADINYFASGTRNITAIGGYLDGPNTGYAIAGKSEYTVSAVVAPIPILLTTEIGGNLYFRNVGTPRGIRHINIENFEPGVQVAVGSRNFIVFPWMAKRSNTVTTFPPGSVVSTSRFPQAENSAYLGYAYELD